MSYIEQVRDLWKQYREDVSTDPVDLKTVASWAIAKGLWKPPSCRLEHQPRQRPSAGPSGRKAGGQGRARVPSEHSRQTPRDRRDQPFRMG